MDLCHHAVVRQFATGHGIRTELPPAWVWLSFMLISANLN